MCAVVFEDVSRTSTPSAPTDEALAARAARGDAAAFEALVRRHAGPLLAYCRRLLGDPIEAEDRVQDALIRAYRALDRFDASRRFAPWLFRIAHNGCVDALRARRAWAPLDEEAAPAPAAPLAPEQSPAIAQAVADLPARHRAVLHLKYTLGLDAAEIAARLDTTPGNVRVVLHRAIKLLRERLS
ncbi:MAG: sigma-70 family RNA polymerase sigma factor [Planctomycetes bacterium]|nr:sigma-70 family RNA polymerase sigma factor [Planctomycetota bacterium]